MSKDPDFVKDIINEEEKQFLKTLRKGRAVLERTVAKQSDKTTLPGNNCRYNHATMCVIIQIKPHCQAITQI